MTAPVYIIITASGTHLATADVSATLCGEAVGRPFLVVAYEPGADLGERKGDCAKCAKAGK